MLKLIHADLYKTFHRSYFYVLTLAVAALCVGMQFALRGGNYGHQSISVQLAISLLSYPIILLPMFTQIVTAEEYRDHTLKNTISYGTNRTGLFVSKWLTAILLGIVMTVVVVGVYFASMMLILPRDAAFTPALVREFFIRLGASCAVYVACIAMSAFFVALFGKGTLSIFLFYGTFYLAELLLKLFHLNNGIDYLLKTQIANIASKPVAQLQQPVLISLVTMAVFFVGGAVIFRKKDLC